MNVNSSTMLSTLVQVCSAFFERRDRDTLLRVIINSMIDLSRGDRGTVFLVPDGVSSGEMTSLVATGLEGREIKVDINQGIAGYVYRTGLPLMINDVRKDARFFSKIDENTGYQTNSILSVPLRAMNGRLLGVVEVLNSKQGQFEEQDLQVLQVLSVFAGIALEQRTMVDDLTEANEKLKQVGALSPREEFAATSTSAVLQDIYDRLPTYAKSDSSILIEGESGTGKEVVAQMVHMSSARRDRAFVAVNCAAIPESLFEAELFGVAKGAATGTVARRGKVELASGGTLFLDEIGELPLSAQAKLLRVLQDRAVTRVGSDERPRPVDFRIIAATNRNLAEMVREKKFREDLFYRLNVVTFTLPPLRERTGDIADLCRVIMSRFLTTRGWKPKTIGQPTLEKLKSYPWPGNIRQLGNKLENALILSGDRKSLEPGDFQLDVMAGAPLRLVPKAGGDVAEFGEGPKTFDLRMAKEDFERRLIERVLKETNGNKSAAARMLGITREGLRKAMLKWRAPVVESGADDGDGGQQAA